MKKENSVDYHRSSNQKMVIGSSQEIAKMTAEKKLIEPGGHNLLVYDKSQAFREIYTEYTRTFLPQNEIIVIGTQYETINQVKNTLRLAGIDVERYLNQGRTLFILDAQQGYQDLDIHGMWKLAMSLISRAKKEGRLGVTWYGDLGSFFSFEKIEELMQYELSLPQKYKDSIKIVCSYHLRDFEKLTEAQQHTLFDHHSKSIVVE